MADGIRVLVFDGHGTDVAAGWLALAASDRGVRLLVLPCVSPEEALATVREQYPEAHVVKDDPVLSEVAAQVQAYFEGHGRSLHATLDLRGHTSFALSVWAAAGMIPYGETRNYRWVAEHAGGGPGTFQATGAALGANPVPLLVPCHRVVGSDGSLTGYAGGLDLKAWLLAMERGQGVLGLD